MKLAKKLKSGIRQYFRDSPYAKRIMKRMRRKARRVESQIIIKEE